MSNRTIVNIKIQGAKEREKLRRKDDPEAVKRLLHAPSVRYAAE